MADLYPGVHPSVDLSRLEPVEVRVANRLAQIFHVTRDGAILLGGRTSNYNYILIKPSGKMRGILHTDREVIVLFSRYSEFQARTLDAFDEIIKTTPEEFRIEKVARILLSADAEIERKLKSYFEGRPDAPVVIPFRFDELGYSSTEQAIIDRIRRFTFSRDLFSVSSPLKSDLYFFGRSQLINEICSKITSGENFGLFGLRRSGKTSLIGGVQRALRSRGIPSIILDCQSPSVHQLRWNKLLEHIVVQLRDAYPANLGKFRESDFDLERASASFVREVRALRKRLKVPLVAILFDEIERISLGTASSVHWNEAEDFLLFWQAIRAGFQAEDSPFTFLIVGTNPRCIEIARVGLSDNPLFGNVQKRFIPMFSHAQVGEMVNSLGEIMGVTFNDETVGLLARDFGGHPFLIRQVCSQIARISPQRPVVVDRTLYAVGYQEFTIEADSYVDSVVEMLRTHYEDEYEMLKLLGEGDFTGFNTLAHQDPTLLEHLKGYGLVSEGSISSYFNVGVVEKYFAKKSARSQLMTGENKLAEAMHRRTALERRLRSLIFNVASITQGRKSRQHWLLQKLRKERQEQFKSTAFEHLLNPEASPLYFDELKAVILGYWDLFSNAIDLQKEDFDHQMKIVNKLRKDAHSNTLSDLEFDKLRVALSELEACFS